MKKILPALLILFLLLTLPVHAASGRLTAKADAAGDTVTVTVRLDNPGIIATRIFVRYDPQALRLTDAKNGEVFPNGNAVFGKDLSADPYTMLWDESLRRDNNTTSGTLCTLTFAVVGGSANGTTNVKIAVDKSSTFDVDLNAVTVADGACDISVPIATTKANAGTAVTDTTKPSAPDPAANTTGTTKKTADSTATTKAAQTTKALQTTKPAATTVTPTGTLPKPTITIPDKTGTPEQTAKPSAASTTASAAGAPSTASQGAAAGTASPDETAAAEPATGETIPDLLTSGTLPESVSETTADAPAEPEPTRASHRNLLWLLLLIPAAAAIVLVVRKKKA